MNTMGEGRYHSKTCLETRIVALTPVGLDLSRCLTAPQGPMQESERRLVVGGSYRMLTYRGWELEATTRLHQS